MKVVHIITSVKPGGAEIMLLRLLEQLRSTDYDPYVIGLSTAGDVSERIEKLGIPVDALGVRKGVPDPSSVLKVALRRDSSDRVGVLAGARADAAHGCVGSVLVCLPPVRYR